MIRAEFAFSKFYFASTDGLLKVFHQYSDAHFSLRPRKSFNQKENILQTDFDVTCSCSIFKVILQEADCCFLIILNVL